MNRLTQACVVVATAALSGCSSSDSAPSSATSDAETGDVAPDGSSVADPDADGADTPGSSVEDVSVDDVAAEDTLHVDSTAGDTTTGEDVAPPVLPAVPVDRSILHWTEGSGLAHDQALLPKDFAGVDDHACAADPTRRFIEEIVTFGIDDIQVAWHWAPVISGPNEALRPIRQPEFALAGTLDEAETGDGDVKFDHVFGADFNTQVKLDPEFAFLNHRSEVEGQPGIHAELSKGLHPEVALGFSPLPGDRTLLQGAWVLDCGHAPYGGELHPPTFVAFARASTPTETIASTFVSPYRDAQLFNSDVSLSAKFDDDSRFTASGTAPFSLGLVSAIIEAVSAGADYLVAHELVEATRFDTLRFSVCAPLPRPEGAVLEATWRFTARTGIAVDVIADDATGCVHITAAMDPAVYVPMPLIHGEQPWPWEALNEAAGDQAGQAVDVRTYIQGFAKDFGITGPLPSLELDHPPHADHYEPLAPRPGADQDAPMAIVTGADDQPFPLYGRVRATWK